MAHDTDEQVQRLQAEANRALRLARDVDTSTRRRLEEYAMGLRREAERISVELLNQDWLVEGEL